jgi:hypothetical protein
VRFLILTLMLIFAINALAYQDPRPIHALVTFGSEYRPEKDIDGNFVTHTLSNYAIGGGYRSWIFTLEKANFEESSGNATLSVKRSLDDMMIWADWRALSWNYMAPFLGGGVGYYKEKVDTTLMGSTTSNESKNRLLTGGAFGVSLDVPYVWLSFEARLLFGDELDRQPTIGGLLRFGACF